MHGDQVIHVQQLGPDTVQLIHQPDGGFVLRNADHDTTIRVTPAEAAAFRLRSAVEIEDFFALAGGLSGTVSPSPLGEVAAALMHGIPTLTTMTDTTTVAAAQLAVEGPPRPELLLDLSTLIHCCVLYDSVIVDNPPVTMPAELSDIITAHQTFRSGTGDPRQKIAVIRESELQRDPRLREELESGWRDMLDCPVTIAMRSFDSITDSPGITPYFPAGSGVGFYDPLDESTLLPGSGQAADPVSTRASIQTFRFWINEQVAETLGVSYNCTSLRFPVERVATLRRRRFRAAAEQLLHWIDVPQRPLQPMTDTAQLPRFRFPGLLGLVLHRARTRHDIWSEVRELRDVLSPLREELSRNQLDGGPLTPHVERILQDAFPGRRHWADAMDASLADSAKIAGGLTGDATAGAMLKTAQVLKPFGWLRERHQRLLRPELKVVRDLRQDFRTVATRTAQIERLWRIEPDAGWMDAAQRISAGATRDATRLHQAGS